MVYVKSYDDTCVIHELSIERRKILSVELNRQSQC